MNNLLRTLTSVCLLAIGVVNPVSAQTVTTPTRLVVRCPLAMANATKNLTADQNAGDWSKFQVDARQVIQAISCTLNDGQQNVPAIDTKKDVVVLLWPDKPPMGGDPVVYRGVIAPSASDPFTDTLPGVGATPRAFEVFVSAGRYDTIATTYTSTRQRNPLEEQLPAVAEAIVNPLLGALAATQRQLRSAPPGAPKGTLTPTHYATVSRIILPFARSTVHVDFRAGIAPTAESIKSDAEDLANTNARVTGAHAACTTDFNTSLSSMLKNAAPGCSTGDDKTCSDALIPEFNKQYLAAAKQCTSELESKELLAVDASYRNYVVGLAATKVTGAFDLKNAPKQLVSFGVMTAYAMRGRVDGTRVKLNDDGNLTADPLGRQLNLVVVNVGFKPYNAEAFHPTPAERFQWFVGAVVTPDFGVGVGLSAKIVRGLTANIGGAVLGVKSLQNGDALGSAPKNSEDAFGLSPAKVFFVGVGYVFK
jgi:hypothetical protein